VRRALLLLLVATTAGCTTPLADGERLYREGDRLGALETWRSIPEASSESEEAQQRIAVVEGEFKRLVRRYKQRARYFEAKERLAESILDYRLALKLQPDDADTLTHVQKLARTVASRKTELTRQYDEAFAREDLAAARKVLKRLRELDPFDPEAQTEERELHSALRLAVTRGLAAGQRQFIAGNLTGATNRFRSVLALDPENETARGSISQIVTILREREATAERSATFASQERFLSDAELRAEGFYQNALESEKSGDLYTAIHHDRSALEVDSEHQAARRHLNELRSRLAGEVEKEIEQGRSAYRDDDLLTALLRWKRALLIDPDNERARAYVDRAERQLQNLDRLRSEPDVSSRGE
jgi:tetratricopeptide (TPR) repeat protein